MFEPPTVDLRKYVLETAALRLVSREFCLREGVIPIALAEGALVVAMADPTKTACIGELATVTGLRIEPVKATASDVNEAIEKYYARTI